LLLAYKALIMDPTIYYIEGSQRLDSPKEHC